MKKLSLIMAMVLIATIGGVYATWQYQQDVSMTVEREITVTLQGATIDGAAGQIGVTIPADFSIKVTNVGNYWTALSASGADIAITFTPSAGADANIADGVTLGYRLELHGSPQYNSEAIFATPVATVRNIAYVQSGDTKYIPVADLLGGAVYTDTGAMTPSALSCIQLAKQFKLDTHAKHDAFETALGATYQFKLIVSIVNVDNVMTP